MPAAAASTGTITGIQHVPKTPFEQLSDVVDHLTDLNIDLDTGFNLVTVGQNFYYNDQQGFYRVKDGANYDITQTDADGEIGINDVFQFQPFSSKEEPAFFINGQEVAAQSEAEKITQMARSHLDQGPYSYKDYHKWHDENLYHVSRGNLDGKEGKFYFSDYNDNKIMDTADLVKFKANDGDVVSFIDGQRASDMEAMVHQLNMGAPGNVYKLGDVRQYLDGKYKGEDGRYWWRDGKGTTDADGKLDLNDIYQWRSDATQEFIYFKDGEEYTPVIEEPVPQPLSNKGLEDAPVDHGVAHDGYGTNGNLDGHDLIDTSFLNNLQIEMKVPGVEDPLPEFGQGVDIGETAEQIRSTISYDDIQEVFKATAARIKDGEGFPVWGIVIIIIVCVILACFGIAMIPCEP